MVDTNYLNYRPVTLWAHPVLSWRDFSAVITISSDAFNVMF